MAKKKQVGPDADLASYFDKPASATQLRFSNWLVRHVGLKLDAMTPFEAFTKGVSLGTVLRPAFQQSPENQDHIERRRRERVIAEKNRTERLGREAQVEAEIISQVPESVQRSEPSPRPRRQSRASQAAAKMAEPVPTAPGPAGPPAGVTVKDVPGDVVDPFADDEPAGTPEDPIEETPINPSDPPGSLWLGGPKAAAKGQPAGGGTGPMRPAPW